MGQNAAASLMGHYRSMHQDADSDLPHSSTAASDFIFHALVRDQEGVGVYKYDSTNSRAFDKLSIVRLQIPAHTMIAPHWTDANKVAYCTHADDEREPVVVCIHDGGGKTEHFHAYCGDMFHVPRNRVHHIENRTDSAMTIVLALDAGRARTIALSSAFCALNKLAVRSLFHGFPEEATLATEHVGALLVGPNDTVAAWHEGAESPSATSRYKLDMERGAQRACVYPGYSGNFLTVGMKATLDSLTGVGLLFFGLDKDGSVEPHWHTNSDEIVYVIEGTIRATILGPDGVRCTELINKGGGFYAKAGYFHSFENVGGSQMRGLAFFNNPEMEYVGMGEAMGHLTDGVLRSVLPFSSSDVFEQRTLVGPTGARPTQSVVITHLSADDAKQWEAKNKHHEEDPLVKRVADSRAACDPYAGQQPRPPRGRGGTSGLFGDGF